MLDPCVVAVRRRWRSPQVAPIRIVGPLRRAPVVERERRIRYDAVKGRKPASLKNLWVAERVALHDAEIRRAMQEEVHLGYGRVDGILLLSEDESIAELGILRVVDGLYEHSARSACRVIDALPRLWIKYADKQFDYGARRVELARFRLGFVSKLLEEYFIRVTHQVGGVVLVAETTLGEVFDEVAEALVADDGLVREVGRGECAQDAVERVGVRLFDEAQRLDDGGAEVLVASADILPMAPFRDDEKMLFGESGILHVAAGFPKRRLEFLVPSIAQALVVEKRCEIILEALVPDWSTQVVAGLVDEVVEILRALHLASSSKTLAISRERLSISRFSSRSRMNFALNDSATARCFSNGGHGTCISSRLFCEMDFITAPIAIDWIIALPDSLSVKDFRYQGSILSSLRWHTKRFALGTTGLSKLSSNTQIFEFAPVRSMIMSPFFSIGDFLGTSFISGRSSLITPLSIWLGER